MFFQAINLKNAIRNAPDKLTAIRRCYLDEFEHQGEEEMMQKIKQTFSMCNNLSLFSKGNIYSKFKLSIKIEDGGSVKYQYNGDACMGQEQLRRLYGYI